MLEVMEELALPVDELLPAEVREARARSWSYSRKWAVQTVEEVLAARPQVALFSAGGDVSKKGVFEFAKAGITVIDNSSTAMT